jgi:hypothetical protein
MAQFAKAQTEINKARTTLDDALANVAIVEAPLDFMRDVIGEVYGAQSSVIGTIDGIFSRAKLLSQDIENYIESTSDLFSGNEITGSAAATSDTLLSIVIADADDLNAFTIENTLTPAGSAEAVGQTEELISTALVLEEAVKAARPPIIIFTITEITNLIVFCQKRYKANAVARAEEIMGMNHIPNPAAIPAGTKIFIPSR